MSSGRDGECERVHRLGVLGVRTEPVDTVDAIAAAKLWPVTRAAGLSIAERCCLALAARLNAPAITCDIAWTRLDLGVRILAVRGTERSSPHG